MVTMAELEARYHELNLRVDPMKFTSHLDKGMVHVKFDAPCHTEWFCDAHMPYQALLNVRDGKAK
jgi:hypothetical protein